MTNVGHSYGNKVKCPICKLENKDDTQEHLFKCIILKIKCPELYRIQDKKYLDIFSLDSQKIIQLANLCESILRTREELLS